MSDPDPLREASPAPLFRPSIGAARGSPALRAPRLGLAIPPSPRAPALSTDGLVPGPEEAPRGPPRLSLATPSGSAMTPPPGRPASKARGGPKLTLATIAPGATGSSAENSAHEQRPNSSGDFDKVLHRNVNDPVSAISSVSADSGELVLPDLSKLSLEVGRALEPEDLGEDESRWRAAAKENKIQELGHLGEGASGAVTRCKLEGGKTVFALKVITADPNPDVRKQILRELNFNKKLSSSHICAYYGAYINETHGTISIAMEFCQGGSLDAIYKRVRSLGGRTGEKVLGKIAEGVLRGLTYLHDNRIIHRDIKPSNILLTRSGVPKLCDFGVSGESGTGGAANTFIGTSYYMAPERITGQSYTITSDVWSLGVTLLEVAMHRFPFPAEDPNNPPSTGTTAADPGPNPRLNTLDLLQYIVRQPIPKLRDIPAEKVKWSENFKYFIECCLEKETRRRATPWRLLEHPWIEEMQGKRVDMEKFVRQVWGWTDTTGSPEAQAGASAG